MADQGRPASTGARVTRLTNASASSAHAMAGTLRLCAVLVGVLSIVLHTAAVAQVRRFRGTWFGPETDSTVGRMLSVDSMSVRTREACMPTGKGVCDYTARFAPYAAIGPSGVDSAATTLLVQYNGPGWRRVMILSLKDSDLEALVLTQIVRPGGRVSRVERQLLSRPVTKMARPSMPQFPWPPPRPTASVQLPDGLLGLASGDSLGPIFDQVRRALDRVDVGWWSAYAIGDDGFAVVTRMEAIEPDGRPKPVPARWATPADRLPRRFGGIGDYLKALLFARPGYYRIIVVAVTHLPLEGYGAPISPDSAGKLLKGGELDLPEWLRGRALKPDGRCVALIYEFMRPSESDSARFVDNSMATAVQHLALAGLWSEEEIRR